MWVESNSQKLRKIGFMGLIQGVHNYVFGKLHTFSNTFCVNNFDWVFDSVLTTPRST